MHIVGAFTPVTMKGNIVVDGVLASYNTSVPHDLAKIAMIPMKWFPSVLDWLLGNDNEIPAYVNILTGIGNYTIPFEK